MDTKNKTGYINYRIYLFLIPDRISDFIHITNYRLTLLIINIQKINKKMQSMVIFSKNQHAFMKTFISNNLKT